MSFLARMRLVLTGLAIAAGICAPAHARQTAVITNTARLSFGSATVTTVNSNTTTLTVTANQAPTIKLLRLAIGAEGTPRDVSTTQCLIEGRGYVSPDTSSGAAFDPAAVKLRAATSFHAGEPVFIFISSPDANRDPAARDVMAITIKTSLDDKETIKVWETGPDTGRFLGYIPVTDATPTSFDCEISAPRGNVLDVTVADFYDGTSATASALIDPYGYIFDSRTGKAIDGAKVTLVDQTTGAPAKVFGDDGVSIYPSTVISGENVVDSGGSVYQFAPGEYRFPLTASGRYALFVEPPDGYAAPSSATEKALAKLTAPDGGAFHISPASWGAVFDLIQTDPLQVDIPLDSGKLPVVARHFVQGLSLEKSASVQKGTFGDLVGYTLSIRNLGSARTINTVEAKDALPRGFRYVTNSSHRDGAPIPDPVISPDGRNLTYALGTLGPAGAAKITYVVAIGPDAPAGVAVNRAIATGALGASSGEAEARVRVAPPMMSDAGTIVGRVTEGACARRREDGRIGVPGVRLVMEDGTYVVSDRDGLFHFEGVKPGIHVVQLDAGALPAGLEAVACGRDTRIAGRAFSQFVEIREGALQRVEFRLRRVAAAPAAPVAAKPLEDAEAGTIDWFAGQELGEGFVFPAEGHNPVAPAIRVVVKHGPGARVNLTINGAPVDPLMRDGVETSADGSLAVSMWRGVPLVEGSNLLVATITNGRGDVIAEVKREVAYANTPAKAALVAEASRLTADGLDGPVVAVRFTDRFGHPVRPGSMGTVEVAEPYAIARDIQSDQRLAGEAGRGSTWRVTGQDGVALITLAPTTKAGSAVLRFKLPGLDQAAPAEVRAWLSAARQDWIVVGFAAGTAGYNTLSRHAAPLARKDRDKTMVDGQLAFYAKGRVRGSWLLTMAYDSKRSPDPERGLTSGIDPDRYYTVYGDGSGQAYDAASQRKLYVRLERKAFYALFGDFQTGFDATRLGRSNRVLNGLKFERQGKVFSMSGFMAQTEQDHVRDELPGSGLASLYQLSRRDIVPNTETVTIETRDRLRAERVLSSRAMTRYVDYDIDYATGALTFRDPIASRDADLNPNVIVANYEILGSGKKNTEIGTRVAANLLKGKARAGVTYLHGRPGAARSDTDLVAADLTVRPRADTEVRLEAATSQSVQTGRQEAWIAEVEHHSARFDVLGYARQADKAFGLGQQNLAQLGARKIGVDGKARLTQRLSLNVSAYHENYLDSGDVRDVVDARMDYQMGAMRLGAGVKSAHDTPETGEAVRSDLLTLTAGREFLNRRLQVTASSDFALGDAESLDFPVRRRVGATYVVSERVRILASREIIEGEDYKAAVTGGGVEVSPWKGARLTSALNRQDLSAFGPRTYAQLGLAQSVRLKGGWTLDASIDSASTLAGKAPEPNTVSTRATGAALATEDFTAVSLGAAYRADGWSWNGRVEARRGDKADSWAVRGAYLRQLREGVTAAVTVRADETKAKDGAVSRGAEVAGSLAWRPLDSRWSVLDKLEVRREEAQGVVQGQGIAGYGATARGAGVTGKLINNLAVNFDSDRGDHTPGSVQASLYHGAKLVRGRLEGEARTNFVQVVGAEARFDLTHKIDLGVNLSLRHAGKSGGTAYAIGPSVGISPAENTWMSIGWNAVGYHDPDFASVGYSRRGFYVTARVKFDQNTFGGLLNGRR
uniref:hypothetical protein n=1 Tax=uncultured Caulobacter sp. TaxID=158749 RepID=UPI0025DE6C93|nr:hypothetical protein [uncultured Caulobacter sp.]